MQISEQGPFVIAASPAKLNLQLAILGRRADRFHELETVMLKVSLFDRLWAAGRHDGRLSLSARAAAAGIGPAMPLGEDNLVIQAAHHLQHHAGVRFGADLTLEKRIPAEAGLAGGSGNAAAALLALNRLWRLDFSREELRPLAAQLGSDVPFFMDSAAAALAWGRGEQLQALPVRGPFHFVILKPAFGLATAAVYRRFAQAGRSKLGNGAKPGNRADSPAIAAALASGNPGRVGAVLQNDLSAAAEALAPPIAQLRSLLNHACPAGALMSGSGSALFGICRSARQARWTARRIGARNLGRTMAVASI